MYTLFFDFIVFYTIIKLVIPMKYIHVGIDKEYKSINEAIKNNASPLYIYLDDEVYYEKVVIDKNDVTIDGLNKAKIVYDDYAIKIHEDGREYVTFRTYTLLVKSNNVTLKNLIVENSAGEGHVVGQAVALHLYGDNINVINCKLLAKQDTLFCGPLSDDLIERYVDLLPDDERFYDNEFHHYFNDCYIEGTVDFIFGGASAIFKNCDIVSLPTRSDTYIVAPNHHKDNNHGMIFENCRFIKHKDTKDKSVYLARPWRDYGFVTFKDCYLDTHIKEEGFSIWEGTDRHLHARFIEINSTGPGSNNAKRISWSKVK